MKGLIATLREEIDIWNKMIAMRKASWNLPHWEAHDISTSSNTTFNALMEAFLVKECKFSHLMGKKLYCLHRNDFLNFECELYLKKLMTPTQRKIIIVYCINSIRDDVPLLFESVMYY